MTKGFSMNAALENNPRFSHVTSLLSGNKVLYVLQLEDSKKGEPNDIKSLLDSALLEIGNNANIKIPCLISLNDLCGSDKSLINTLPEVISSVDGQNRFVLDIGSDLFNKNNELRSEFIRDCSNKNISLCASLPQADSTSWVEKDLENIDYFKLSIEGIGDLPSSTLAHENLRFLKRVGDIYGANIIVKGISDMKSLAYIGSLGIDLFQSLDSDISLENGWAGQGIDLNTVISPPQRLRDIAREIPIIPDTASILKVKKVIVSDSSIQWLAVIGDEGFKGLVSATAIYHWYLEKGLIAHFQDNKDISFLIDDTIPRLNDSVNIQDAKGVLCKSGYRGDVFIVVTKSGFMGIGTRSDLWEKLSA